MPTIPKYNQRSTSDLNYAKRRVVEAEKEGIAKLIGRTSREFQDANKLAELLIKSMENLIVLIQRLTGFIELGESLTDDLDLDLEFNLASWDLVNKNNYPKVVGLIVSTNLYLKRIVALVKEFQKIFNFTSPINIQKIKDIYDGFFDYLNIFNSVSFNPTPRRCSRLPRRDSMAFMPIPPNISLISRDQACSKFTSLCVPISGLSLFVRNGSCVAIPQLHFPV